MNGRATLPDINHDRNVDSTWVISFRPGALDQGRRMDNQRYGGVVDDH